MKKILRSLLLMCLLIAVIAALVWYGDAAKVSAQIGRFRRIYLAWFAALMIVHEFVRALLWAYLLQGLGTRAHWRTGTFAFAAGEAAKFVPTGAYLQNYLLQRSTRTDFGRSSAATTVMIAGEIAAAVIFVEVLGVGSWSLGLRIAILCVLVFTALAAKAILSRWSPLRHLESLRTSRVAELALMELKRFRAGTAALAQPRIIGMTLLLSLLYVLIAGMALYVVIRALGISDVSLAQAVGVSSFGLAFYVVLGSLEAADVGAFAGLGVSKSAAVSTVLVNRGLSIGMTLVLALITMFLLRGEAYAALRRRRSEAAFAAHSADAANPEPSPP